MCEDLGAVYNLEIMKTLIVSHDNLSFLNFREDADE
jgi:hypothetical protein